MKRLKHTDMNNQEIATDNQIPAQASGKLVHGIVFSIIVITLLVVISLKILDPMTLPIRHVSINGDFNRLSPISLQERASNVVRGGFFNVNVETIQTVVSEEPWVKEIMVRRIWPDRIMVDIKEQQAVAKWGDSALINQGAVIFYPDLSTFPDELPYLSGPENFVALVVDYLNKFRGIIPESLKVEELHLSDRRSWELILDNDLTLHFGKTDVMEKARQFFKYYSQISNNDNRHIHYVDLRYPNGFVIGWKSNNQSELNNGRKENGKKI
ncbi:MAG: FtsQ-type POTRA domain-containing protein [Gammaproteobacteria bacterium]|nr:FtsQ-type POTRA domain-containing protein [Gammaproteobacteria bacterium]